jgi:hypothetical protein
MTIDIYAELRRGKRLAFRISPRKPGILSIGAATARRKAAFQT